MKPSWVERLQRGWQMAHPNHRRIAKGMVTVAVFLLAAKLVAMLKEIAVASHYGVGFEVDAYLLALTIVTWLPVTLWSVSVAVLVPRLVSTGPRKQDDRFLAELNGVATLVALALWPLTWLAGPWLVERLASGASANARALASSMTIQMAAFSTLSLAAGYLAILLQARSNQAYTLFEAMPALGILTLLLLPWPTSGTLPLVLGTVAGGVVQVGVLGLLVQKAQDHLGGFALRHRSTQWHGLYRSSFVMAAAQIVIGLATPIDQFVAASLGDGAIAKLGYANRVVAIVVGLGATTIFRAILPTLAETVSQGQHQLARDQAWRWMQLMFGLGTAATAIGWMLAPWGIGILFERGAFTARDTAAIAQVFRYLLLQLPFFLAAMVGVQLLSARRMYRTLLLATVATLLAKLSGVALLTPLLGVNGIALSTALMYLVSALVILWNIQKLG